MRYWKQKESRTSLQRIEEENRKDITDDWMLVHCTQSSPSLSHQRKWSPEDEEIIEGAFEKDQKVPSEYAIKTKFFMNAQLKEIQERNGFNRCYVKVKNLFKRRKSCRVPLLEIGR